MCKTNAHDRKYKEGKKNHYGLREMIEGSEEKKREKRTAYGRQYFYVIELRCASIESSQFRSND
jgi:hypothetical protein